MGGLGRNRLKEERIRHHMQMVLVRYRRHPFLSFLLASSSIRRVLAKSKLASTQTRDLGSVPPKLVDTMKVLAVLLAGEPHCEGTSLGGKVNCGGGGGA
jgi:hypothetical protein